MSVATTEKEPVQVTSLPTTLPLATPINLTERAAAQVKQIIQQEKEKKEQAGAPVAKIYLRLVVRGAGCSGFKDSLELEDTINPKMDNVFEVHGVDVVIDRRSELYLQGATVDFHNELNRQGFSIGNPNAKTTCGCGSSYSM